MTTTIEMTKVKSSNIESIGYNAEKLELLVGFKGGKVFGYKYVSNDEYKALFSAESVGSHFSKFIKNTKVAKEVTKKETENKSDTKDKNNVIAELKDRLESALAHVIMIERIASHTPIDKEILKIAKEALEVDKAKSNI